MFTLIGSAQQGGPYKVLKTGQGRRRRRLGLHLCRRRRTPAVHSAPRRGAGVQTRLTIFNLDTLRAGRRDCRCGRQWHRGRPEVGAWLHQQQTRLDCSTRKTMSSSRPSMWAPHNRTAIYFDAFNERVVRLQPPDQGRDGDRRQDGTVLGKIRSWAACRTGRGRRAKHALRGDAGRAGQCYGVDVRP